MSGFYYIEVNYYNESSKESDYCIVSEDNTETLSTELAMQFKTENDARNWLKTENAKAWLPCTFEIKKEVCYELS